MSIPNLMSAYHIDPNRMAAEVPTELLMTGGAESIGHKQLPKLRISNR
jgi:hypothetical protein